ncbi:septation protein A [Lacisediminimonas sp.]|uniref:septation protein A n=1 Tax=Lacisediminimonas sp. TaxID=3060582 RepID=UPI002720DF94|nr:septation protein A [Lacisediminimonas sp.]MDO8300986.1 septation protein A [Lacisediminimonas sp.]
MKLLFDLLPVILFFAMFKWGEGHPEAAQQLASQYLSGLVAGGSVTLAQAPILLATSIAILATLFQITLLLARKKKIDGMLWVSLAIITVFGGATIYFNNETFIKWKPTVLYLCFALALAFARYAMQRNLIRSMMGKQMSLPEPLWDKLNLAWIVFFLLMAAVNLFVAFNFTTATWVSFKLFGFMGLMIAFVIGQTLLLSKHMKEPG